MSLVIDIPTLQRLACNVEAYEQSPRYVAGVGLVYPDGWTAAEAERIACSEHPDHLLWLALHKFVPMTMAEARELTVRFHAQRLEALEARRLEVIDSLQRRDSEGLEGLEGATGEPFNEVPTPREPESDG